MAALRREGRLVACEVVLAEMAAFFPGETEAVSFLHDLGIEFDSVGTRAALLTGKIFRSYRNAGGPREHLIPDFLIGAHSLIQSDQLAATDKGYLRRYFPKLKVIAPVD